jgi:hypothetical protein
MSSVKPFAAATSRGLRTNGDPIEPISCMLFSPLDAFALARIVSRGVRHCKDIG